MSNFKRNLVAIGILLLLDFMWIGLFMGKKYNHMISEVQGSDMKVKLPFVILAYLLMIIGLVIFVLPNIRKKHELQDSLMYGFVFGIVVYGIYDFTAGAIITKWNSKLALIDILWGGFVFGITAYLTSQIIPLS